MAGAGKGFVDFTSFNHINDYGEQGFAALDREIASSHPLVVWAPSLFFLDKYYHDGNGTCKVSPDQFIHYVEEGYVEVIGRDWWLRDRQERKHRAESYEGATWTAYDDRLRDILLNFDNLPDKDVHVRIVPDEVGFTWAEQVLDDERQEHGGKRQDQLPIVTDVQDMLRRGEVPQGTAERAKRAPTPEKQAIEVLRDVKNHTDAYHQANGKGFIMSPEDSRFLQLLERNPNFGAGPTAVPVKQDLPKQIYSGEFEEAVLSLLERLTHPGQRPTFSQFVGSEAHRDLVYFTGSMYDEAQIVKLDALSKFVRRELRKKIEASIPDQSWWPKSMFQRMKMMEEWGSLALKVIEAPTGIGTLGGLGLSVIKLAYRSLQRFGVIADDYQGPQWPFLYMFGRKAHSPDYSPLLGRLWSAS